MMNCWCGGLATGDVCLDSPYHAATATGRRDKHTKLYLAGPMSGYKDNNYPAFHLEALALRSFGYEVVSPAELESHPNGRVHYVDLIREDLRLMLDCHGVAVMNGWWESVGARNEVNVAGVLKMPVRPVAEWIELHEEELS